MVDHRALPGIEFVPCPGPLRVGDYWRGEATGTVYDASDADIGDTAMEPARVIPVVRPLEVPEETTFDFEDVAVCDVLGMFCLLGREADLVAGFIPYYMAEIRGAR